MKRRQTITSKTLICPECGAETPANNISGNWSELYNAQVEYQFETLSKTTLSTGQLYEFLGCKCNICGAFFEKKEIEDFIKKRKN